MICISVRIRTEPPKSQASQPLTNLSQASHQPLRREASRTLWESLGASASLRRSHSINTDTHAISHKRNMMNMIRKDFSFLNVWEQPLTSLSQASHKPLPRLSQGSPLTSISQAFHKPLTSLSQGSHEAHKEILFI